MFTILRDALPSQFHRAYPTDEDRERARSIWSEGLKDIEPKDVKFAAERVLKQKKFLPSIAEIREISRMRYYEQSGLKDPLQAYQEACNAEPQTMEYHWSHVAVYLAARETGWMTLRGEEQRIAFPLFERYYSGFCERVLAGEDLLAEMQSRLDSPQAHTAEAAWQQADQQQQEQMKAQGIDPKGGRKEFLKLRKQL
ncbi:hypothetical protein [Spongorhabdus nitratireducens]